MGYSFQLAARVLLYAPFHRQDSTYHSLCYTNRGALAGMRNRSMGPTPWRIDPTIHRTMSECSYHGATSRSCCHMGYSFQLAARVLLYVPFHRHDSTYQGLCYTNRGALAGMRNRSMGPTPWRIDPTIHRTMSECSYHGATSRSCCHMGYSFQLAARVLLYVPFHRHDSTYHSLCYHMSNAI